MTTPEHRPEDSAIEQESAAEPVYAPASERVPRTVPEYGDGVSQTDAGTAERQAAAQAASDAEPSVTRVARPPYAATDTGEAAWDTPDSTWMSRRPGGGLLPLGLGWLTFGIVGGVGFWLWLRHRREQNKPINRFRRRARQAASDAQRRAAALREQMPDLPEMPELPYQARPAIGLGTALLSLALIVWQQSQSRSRAETEAAAPEVATSRADRMSDQARKLSKQAVETISDVAWMERLQQLKELWNPRQVELEKISIPRGR
jgi:hypothetical protein